MRKVISFYPKPKDLKIEDKNLKIEYSLVIIENYKQAKTRIKIKDFHSALLLCNKCLETNEEYLKAILLKAYIFFELNDYHRAYCNVLLAYDIETEYENNNTLTLRMLIRYLLSCSKNRRAEIVNYLDYMKKIRHQFICDL